jgi:hypothetical protein
MKLKLFLMVIVIALAVPMVNADLFQIPLPELVGENQAPGNIDFSFDFGTSFTQINDLQIQIIGTYTPGQTHGDGQWVPADQIFELHPHIGIFVIPDEGLYVARLYPDESPYDLSESFELKYDATWDSLFDGAGQGQVSLGRAITGNIVDFEPTVDISEAYLIVDGVVPEPCSILLLGSGLYGIRRIKKQKHFLTGLTG